MYLGHFGLNSNPFDLTPRIDFVYRSDAFEENMAHLIYGLENNEAITMITGPVGSGKTLAVHNFLAKLGYRFSFALVTNTQVNSVELLKLILEDLEVETPFGCDKSDLLIIFKNYLLDEHKSGNKVLIVVDEAQNLATDALEEIRLLTNLGQGDYQPVQIVLVGQPELDDIINNPGLVQLRQRIRVHYRLTPLMPGEIENYLNHRMEVAGRKEPVFKPLAIKQIFKFSGGVPRLVNALANASLLSAFVAGRKMVEGKDVDPGEAGLPGDYSMEKPDQDLSVSPPVPKEEIAVPVTSEANDQPEEASGTGKSRKPVLFFVLILLVLVPVVLYFTGNLEDLMGDSPVENRHTNNAVMDAPVESEEQATVIDAVSDQSVSVETAMEDVSQTVPDIASPEVLVVAEVIPVVEEPLLVETYNVHVASFLHEVDAEKYAATLSSGNHLSHVEHHVVADNEWYRVYLGPFADRDLAVSDAERFSREEGLTYYHIIKTTN